MPSDKRSRKRAAREAKLAALQRQRKRRAAIRRTVTIVIIVGVAIGIYASVSSGSKAKATATTTTAKGTTTTAKGTTTTKPSTAASTIPLPPPPTSLPATRASTAAQKTADTAAATAAGCPSNPKTALTKPSWSTAPALTVDKTKTYIATVQTDVGTFTASLDPSMAPKTVNSFVFLANHDFFNCVIFHRVIQGFVIQGGDPTGTGTGGPGYEFADELPTKGPPYYPLASLAMANSGKNTNGSQFFIIIGSQGEQLPASYSLFGQVTSGYDVVAQIAADGAPSNDPTGTGAPAFIHRMLKVSVAVQ